MLLSGKYVLLSLRERNPKHQSETIGSILWELKQLENIKVLQPILVGGPYTTECFMYSMVPDGWKLLPFG